MRQRKILVTGGCGYIGSHVCAQLSHEGYQVLVIDNLSTGYAENLLHGETLFQGDFGDRKLLKSIFEKHDIQAILHFAASIVVEESVTKPLEYYHNNSIKFFQLLEEVKAAQIPHFILSSTAAVYGNCNTMKAVRESDPIAPENPYGRSKVFDEWMLADLARVSSLKHVTLRYFNVAGAGGEGRLGQRGRGTHLIKIVCEKDLQKRDTLTINGDDYDTADGTCIRDYIHVEDLASAHIAALRYLEEGGKSTTLNCGYNRGYSVKEVIHHFEKLFNKSLNAKLGPRRPGDVPLLIADTQKIHETLKWSIRFKDLNIILRSAWEWEKRTLTTTSSAKPNSERVVSPLSSEQP